MYKLCFMSFKDQKVENDLPLNDDTGVLDILENSVTVDVSDLRPDDIQLKLQNFPDFLLITQIRREWRKNRIKTISCPIDKTI